LFSACDNCSAPVRESKLAGPPSIYCQCDELDTGCIWGPARHPSHVKGTPRVSDSSLFRHADVQPTPCRVRTWRTHSFTNSTEVVEQWLSEECIVVLWGIRSWHREVVGFHWLYKHVQQVCPISMLQRRTLRHWKSNGNS
jgi:hypothetical protein